jgi:hypothetical protein
MGASSFLSQRATFEPQSLSEPSPGPGTGASVAKTRTLTPKAQKSADRSSL